MKKFRTEIKLIGIEFIFIYIFCILAHYIFLRNMNVALESEIIFPMLIMILTGECVKIKSDDQYELIKVYEKSLFSWIGRRYIYVMGIQVVLYLLVQIYRQRELKICFSFIVTALFFTSITMLGAVLLKNTYGAIAISGAIWLMGILWKSLSEYKFSKFFYPFNMWAGNEGIEFWVSKFFLLIISILIWHKIRKVSK